MKPTQSIFRMRREYNKWVGNQTLEDFALRFTAKKARRLSISRVGKTALGATAFLALEALAAAATLQYGFINTLYAMLAVAIVIVLTSIPISYHAAKNGLDIDLLTRGAGFGYLGSTITSLIYASFTFIFFAIEAAILASALKALFQIPLSIGYVLCAIAVVPIVTHGITAISRFQVGTQTMWLLLQCSALFVVGYFEYHRLSQWVHYAPPDLPNGHTFNLALFGACSSIFFAMVAQIGEQVDYLRFMPSQSPSNKYQWWFWLLLSGPGWIFVGLIKMLLGSFLAFIAITQFVPYEQAIDPVYMYQMTFLYLTESPTFALVLAGIMVIISQMKINVTNAYAGSIAWSNFFSRLTHSHPGRVVWLIFNVAIALTLMELGIYRVLEAILGIFALIAISWLGSLSADLLINRPLKLSPKRIEFKRGHLYDINPVGFGSMGLATIVGMVAYLGYLGETAKHLAHFLSLAACYIFVPALGLLTHGKYYLAREYDTTLLIPTCEHIEKPQTLTCTICENQFDVEDMSYCPAYGDTICSLCCSLDARCLDMCKPNGRIGDQTRLFLKKFSHERFFVFIDSKIIGFLGLFTGTVLLNAAFLVLIYMHSAPASPPEKALLADSMWTIFYALSIVSGVLAWLFLLAHESRKVAQQESNRQTQLLIDEIEAHKETDLELQNAKEVAERANNAKSRYLSGISHELRTPLQSVLGYAQLLQQKEDIPAQHQRMLSTIRNSGEHLANLIEGLLEISKIEAGRLDLYRQEVKIKELLNQLVQIFQPQAEAKGIEFHFTIHNPLPEVVTTDEKRLKQILINLLSNAIKYTEEGRVDFHIYYRNQVAEFTVVDTGVGINKKDIERIMNPFERVRNQAVPNVPGTGLGLTIVRLLTEVLGGHLEVDSTPGFGSCFSVSLMLSWVYQPTPSTIPEKTIRGYLESKKTVLVIDDDAIHRGLISDILLPLDFITLEAQNAHECIQIMKDNNPDILLMDITMPVMSGLQLSKHLRQQGYRQPIVMLSADATVQKDKEDYNAYDGYITKPIRNRELIERIGQLLNLTWRYTEEPQHSIMNRTTQAIEPTSIELPCHLSAPETFSELLYAVQIGHKRSVVSALKTLRDKNILSPILLDHLTQLADLMRFDKIEKIITENSSHE
ncbi:ATP-binding protein [Marinibactrum halimedae]|nr:ATP-binding protein [Marinibactrum halimedae]MCD9460832.1 ATP-binding protein [Marinibactrum halimedae]